MHVDGNIKNIKDGNYYVSGEIIMIEAKPVAIRNRIAFHSYTS